MINSKSLRIIPKYPLLCGPNLLDPLTHPGRSLADWNSCSYLFHEPSPAILVLVTLSILLSSTLNAPFIPVRLPISYVFHSPFQWNPVDFCFISKIPEFGGFWWEWMRRKESKITRMDEWTSLSRGELSKHPSRNTWLSGIHHFSCSLDIKCLLFLMHLLKIHQGDLGTTNTVQILGDQVVVFSWGTFCVFSLEHW